MPSGNKILVNVFNWGMTLRILISGYQRTEGLCGSFDDNRSNDLQIRGSSQTSSNLNAVIDSWRYATVFSNNSTCVRERHIDHFAAVIKKNHATVDCSRRRGRSPKSWKENIKEWTGQSMPQLLRVCQEYRNDAWALRELVS